MKQLEKGKVYILFTRTNSYISHKIRQFSDCEISVRERASHVAGLFFNWFSSTWCVIEAHYGQGVVFKTFDNWLATEYNRKEFAEGETNIELMEYPQLKPSELFKYIGRPYAIMDIVKFLNMSLTGNYLKRDYEGYTCSELLAVCDGDGISTLLNKSSHLIRPVDWQLLAIKENRKVFDVKELFEIALLGVVGADQLPVAR